MNAVDQRSARIRSSGRSFGPPASSKSTDGAFLEAARFAAMLAPAGPARQKLVNVELNTNGMMRLTTYDDKIVLHDGEKSRDGLKRLSELDNGCR